MPAIGDTIYVNYTINGNTELIFGGTLVTSEPIVTGGVLLLYQMTAMDWGYALDANVVKANYAGMDPHDIVVDLIANFAPAGFTTNHVQKGNFLVSTIQFNYQQLSKALQALATQIGWDWYIDPDKDVHFYFAEGNAASSSEISLAPIIIDDTTGDIEWPTLDVQVDITNMKNAVYVVGGTYQKNFVARPQPDRHAAAIRADRRVHRPSAWHVRLSALLFLRPKHDDHHARRRRAINRNGPSDRSRPPSKSSTTIPAASSNSRATPAAADQIIVQGEANVPILAYVTDDASIATYGIREDAISDSKILSVQQAQERAQADIDMFGDPVYTVKFNTISPYTNQLSIGQQITLNSAKFGVSNKPLIIKQINFVARTPTQLEAQVQCLGSEVVSFQRHHASALAAEPRRRIHPSLNRPAKPYPHRRNHRHHRHCYNYGNIRAVCLVSGQRTARDELRLLAMGDIKQQGSESSITGKIKVDVFRAGYADAVAAISQNDCDCFLRHNAGMMRMHLERSMQRSSTIKRGILHPHRRRMPEHRHGQPELRDRPPHPMALRRRHVRFTVLPLSYHRDRHRHHHSHHHRHRPHHPDQSRSRRLPAGLRNDGRHRAGHLF